MIPNSRQFRIFSLQVAKRRRDLLRVGQKSVFYPPIGQLWSPSDAEITYTEAFTVLFVAELETYLEWVIEVALEVLENSLFASGATQCKGATPYMEKITEKRQQINKNNNANWSKVEHFFEFVGIGKANFPNDFWDDVEVVVRERGGIVHKSLGLRVLADPRITIQKAESIFRKLRIFDRDFVFWVCARKNEIVRLQSIELTFQPGLGSLATSAPV